MNRKRKEKWEKIRSKGQSEFVLKQGGLIMGLLVFGLLVPTAQFIFEFITSGYSFSFFDKEFLARAIFGLIIAFPFGCLWGLVVWKINEWQYRRHK